MSSIIVYIQVNHPFYREIKYTWSIVCDSLDIKSDLTENPDIAHIHIGDDPNFHIYIPSINFYKIIVEKIYSFKKLMGNEPYLMHDKGIDIFATIFYLVSSVQEYDQLETDSLGRFGYENSLQKKYDIITENVIFKLIEKLTSEVPALASFSATKKRSKFILSHDIDSLYGSFSQDGFWALKKGRVDIMMRLTVEHLIARPSWFNIDKIMNIETAYDYKSTFFWLVNQGKINRKETNADYNIKSAKVNKAIKKLEKNGFENGLHKSISSDTFDQELEKIGIDTKINRNHYLKFTIPSHYKNVEQSKLQADASLGFAGHYGFRNSYGRPFYPYDVQERKEFSFLEFPLTVMDGTFHSYLNIPTEKTADLVIEFLEKNAYGNVLGILWHNTFFTKYKYKGYIDEYKKILSYLYETNFECTLHRDIVEKKKRDESR